MYVVYQLHIKPEKPADMNRVQPHNTRDKKKWETCAMKGGVYAMLYTYTYLLELLPGFGPDFQLVRLHFVRRF